MTIREFSPNEPVSRERLNEVIRGINKLEDAALFQGNLQHFGGAKWSSADYKIQVQGKVATLTDRTPDYIIGRVDYPIPFATTPAVVVSLSSTGAWQIVPFVYASKPGSCEIRVSKIDPSYEIPKSVTVNVLAIGPI